MSAYLVLMLHSDYSEVGTPLPEQYCQKNVSRTHYLLELKN